MHGKLILFLHLQNFFTLHKKKMDECQQNPADEPVISFDLATFFDEKMLNLPNLVKMTHQSQF